MTRIAGHFLKFAASALIIGYVVRQIVVNESFQRLRDQPIAWGMLAVASGVSLLAVAGTFVRWYFLVRALDLPFTIKDAFRLGSLGYMLNLVLIGSVGGDLVKAVLAAREQPGRRTEAVAAVLMDRVVGMYSLILLAAGGIFITGVHLNHADSQVRFMFRAALVAAAVGTGVALLIFVPVFTSPRVIDACRRLPWVGGVLSSLVGAARAYRDKWRVLAGALAISLCTNSLFAITLYSVAVGLPGNHPTLARHFVAVPLSSSTGVIPLPLGALGAFESVMGYLYSELVDGPEQLPDKGMLVALVYRLVTVVVAIFGAAYYATSRREVAEAMRQARDMRSQTV